MTLLTRCVIIISVIIFILWSVGLDTKVDNCREILWCALMFSSGIGFDGYMYTFGNIFIVYIGMFCG